MAGITRSKVILKISCSTGWDSHDYCTGWDLHAYSEIFWRYLLDSFGTGWNSHWGIFWHRLRLRHTGLGHFSPKTKRSAGNAEGHVRVFVYNTAYGGSDTPSIPGVGFALNLTALGIEKLIANTSCCKLTYTHKRTGDLNWCKLVAYHALSDALLHRRLVF